LSKGSFTFDHVFSVYKNWLLLHGCARPMLYTIILPDDTRTFQPVVLVCLIFHMTVYHRRYCVANNELLMCIYVIGTILFVFMLFTGH